MGDSTCVMHAFSYASPIRNEAKEGNPIHALGESISFGRFTSESLSWEKWSTFSHKRYVEEAASYAQPGSVAQKKAFFEAHYKKIAARKAAALLEQANATNNATAPETQESAVDKNEACEAHSDIDERKQDSGAEFSVRVNEPCSVGQFVEPELGNDAQKAELMKENKAPVETPTMNDLPNQSDNAAGSQKAATESELSGTSEMEKPLLKKNYSCDQDVSSATSKKRPDFSSRKSPAHLRLATKVPSSPARPSTHGHLKKVSSVTPIPRKCVTDSMNSKMSPPKSLRSLLRFPSAKEPDKPPAPAVQKKESSIVAPTTLKASKDCPTPLRTPVPAAKNGMPMYPAVTPCSEKRRASNLVDPSVSGSKTTGPKWHILSAVSKSLTACKNKLQSPTLSTPFLLRTEERAARRKQKLEEKFNAKEEEKVQVQTKFKEKAETELRKLRQSFCFKARPLPDFYKKNETIKSQSNKTSVARPQSPKLGRKGSTNRMQGIRERPPPVALSNKDGSRKASNKNSRHTMNYQGSKPDSIAHENTSPNIQH